MMMGGQVNRRAVLMTQFKWIENLCLCFIGSSACLTTRMPTCREDFFGSLNRWMTTSRRAQDRGSEARNPALDSAKEKWKIAYKVLLLMEALKKEPEHVAPIRILDRLRRQISLPEQSNISSFIRKLPRLFKLYSDYKGQLWCGMTNEAGFLVQEEMRILGEHSDKAAEYVTRILMMTVDKRLSMRKISQLRRELGLPRDFGNTWVYRYPQQFKVIRNEDGTNDLELVSWNPDWAVTELEKKVVEVTGSTPATPGLLSLSFPLKLRKGEDKNARHIQEFQKCPYLSPYADARGLKAGSLEFDKRAVAVMHELLSFSIEKMMLSDQLAYFRRELVMPQKLMRLLLKYDGIFYVSEKGPCFSVFLTEAYKGRELIEKCPLVRWKEKVWRLADYKKRKMIKTFSDLPAAEDIDLFDSVSENKNICLEDEHETMGGLEVISLPDNDEMDIGEIQSVYKDI